MSDLLVITPARSTLWFNRVLPILGPRKPFVPTGDDPRWKAFDAAVRPAEFHMARAVLRAHLAAVDAIAAQLEEATRAAADRACAAGLAVLRKGLLRAGAVELPRALRAGWEHGVAQMRRAVRGGPAAGNRAVRAGVPLSDPPDASLERHWSPGDPPWRALEGGSGAKAAPWLARLVFTLEWPQLATYLMDRPRRYSPIAARSTVDAFRAALVDGVERGLGIAEIRREIVDLRLPEISKYRATVIARTEVISASNAASTAAYVESGVVERRRWLATRDPRTRGSKPGDREDHRAWLWPESAQVRRLDQPFVLPSGARLLYPGDTSLGAPAEAWIACRCTTIPEIDLPGLEGIA